MTEQKRDLAADLEICEKAMRLPMTGVTPDDWNFFAVAREGWPHAIRRAMAAEAENERLKEQLAAAHAKLNDLGCVTPEEEARLEKLLTLYAEEERKEEATRSFKRIMDMVNLRLELKLAQEENEKLKIEIKCLQALFDTALSGMEVDALAETEVSE